MAKSSVARRHIGTDAPLPSAVQIEIDNAMTALREARAAQILLAADAVYLQLPVLRDGETEEEVREQIQHIAFQALGAALQEAGAALSDAQATLRAVQASDTAFAAALNEVFARSSAASKATIEALAAIRAQEGAA